VRGGAAAGLPAAGVCARGGGVHAGAQPAEPPAHGPAVPPAAAAGPAAQGPALLWVRLRGRRPGGGGMGLSCLIPFLSFFICILFIYLYLFH